MRMRVILFNSKPTQLVATIIEGKWTQHPSARCFIDRRLSCAAPAHSFPDIGNEVHTLPQVGKRRPFSSPVPQATCDLNDEWVSGFTFKTTTGFGIQHMRLKSTWQAT